MYHHICEKKANIEIYASSLTPTEDTLRMSVLYRTEHNNFLVKKKKAEMERWKNPFFCIGCNALSHYG